MCNMCPVSYVPSNWPILVQGWAGEQQRLIYDEDVELRRLKD